MREGEGAQAKKGRGLCFETKYPRIQTDLRVALSLPVTSYNTGAGNLTAKPVSSTVKKGSFISISQDSYKNT